MGNSQQSQPSATLMPPLTPAEQRAERLGWIIDQLSALAVSRGQVYAPERLRINAEDLIDIGQTELEVAFQKSRRELDYLPQVAEIRRLALADEKGNEDAEMRAAWDITIRHASKWGRWNDERSYAHIESGAPQLPERITDTVRRTGGWQAYLGMNLEAFPFQQKRFFEEYAAWVRTEIAGIELKKLISQPEVKRLVATTRMELPEKSSPDAPVVRKRCKPELSAQDYEIRRQQEKRRIAEWQANRKTT